ncbi:hypothetical protein PMIN01_10061 [Paraphaeosphaeria minitans]|uniref:Uncharacterized protein n=1 Tax=Paraphaeosphaeria minitans TaxID=565426 RepID=A0A9P6GAW6_9PLEO|nr:hypothetical protein PMIN01_10061 [Paraphaeosphaeria minitans]
MRACPLPPPLPKAAPPAGAANAISPAVAVATRLPIILPSSIHQSLFSAAGTRDQLMAALRAATATATPPSLVTASALCLCLCLYLSLCHCHSVPLCPGFSCATVFVAQTSFFDCRLERPPPHPLINPLVPFFQPPFALLITPSARWPRLSSANCSSDSPPFHV